MDQCVRCNEPCSTASVFCDQCRSLLRDQLHQEEQIPLDISEKSTLSMAVVSSTRDAQEAHPEQTPSALDRATPPLQNEPVPISQEETVFLLSDAARRIAEFEPGERRLPRASRLAPFRDISSQIQRRSTPSAHLQGGASTEPMLEAQAEDVDDSEDDDLLADAWSWLPDLDENERDGWEDMPDPLIDRHMPTVAEIAPLEKADVRRARKEGFSVASLPYLPRTHARLRLAFFCLAVLAVLALTMDSILVSFTFMHTQQNQNIRSAPAAIPELTVNPNVAKYGGRVTLHLRHFARSAEIALTRDTSVPLRVAQGNGNLRVDASGAADVETLVDGSWQPGSHMIVAEDILSRYTANASLQIAEGPTPPTHLVLSTNEVDFGAAPIGSTTIQRFVLNNGGGGSITWAASSDASWLTITPNQGVFSDTQTITIGCTRSNLKPGDYHGVITFSSNVGGLQKVQIAMTARALPGNVGPVLAVAPAGLSFTAVDGGADPAAQSLVISNPGSQPLSWTMAANRVLVGTNQSASSGTTAQTAGGSGMPSLFSGSPLFAIASQSTALAPGAFLGVNNASTNWIVTDQSSGTIRPHDSQTLNIMINSGQLLPGSYINTLVFSAQKDVVNMPQNISISLTVLPRCSLTLSTGALSFTAIAGQSNPSSQSFNLTQTTSCTGSLPWMATSSANWLTVAPQTGQMNANNSQDQPSASVNISNLAAGMYTATISILAGQSTQTISVTLNLQPPPPPTAPVMGLSTLSLNLTTTQGAASPSGQLVTIANTGQGVLHWSTTINLLATSWLGAYPSGGIILPGRTGALTVNAITKNLTPGKYVGQIVLNGSDALGNVAGGSPQTVAVTLTVLPPCKITQPSSSSLAFSAVQGGADPSPQSMVLAASGNCLWPLSWRATISGSSSSWLQVTPTSGSFSTGNQPVTLVVMPGVHGLVAGSYSAQVSLAVTDSSGVSVGTAQSFSVSLSVIQPCALQANTNALTVSLVTGATSSQKISLKETGSCVWPVSWTAASDAASNSWLSIPSPSGSDSGSGGSFGVDIATAGLAPGTYKGTITITAAGSGQASVLNSPLTIPVTLTVSSQPTVSVSGIVNACVDSVCSSSSPLAGATVKLQDGNGNTIGVTTSVSSGTYTISGVPIGTYTVLVNGTDTNNNVYTATVQLTVATTVTGLTINATPAG